MCKNRNVYKCRLKGIAVEYAFLTCTRITAVTTAPEGGRSDDSNDVTAMKRVNILLEDDLHTKAKIIAVLKGVTLNDYLAKNVAEAVARDKKVLENVPK